MGMSESVYLKWLGRSAGSAWGAHPCAFVKLGGTPLTHPVEWARADQEKQGFHAIRSTMSQRCQQCGFPMTKGGWILKGGLGWVHYSCVDPLRTP